MTHGTRKGWRRRRRRPRDECAALCVCRCVCVDLSKTAFRHPSRTRRKGSMPSSSATLLYEQGDWSSLWWLPKPGKSATPGEQVAIAGESSQLPHLIFVPSGKPPSTSGWPLLVFLHGQGESSPEDLSRVALQGPPQQAGRMPQHMPFAVLSPQKRCTLSSSAPVSPDPLSD